MKLLTSSLSFGFGFLATVLLTLGFTNRAAQLDPVAQKAEEITTAETGHVASLPCMPCSGADSVDRAAGGVRLA